MVMQLMSKSIYTMPGIKNTYDLAVKYLISALDKYCNEEIDVNELDKLLFNVNYNVLVEYAESNNIKEILSTIIFFITFYYFFISAL